MTYVIPTLGRNDSLHLYTVQLYLVAWVWEDGVLAESHRPAEQLPRPASPIPAVWYNGNIKRPSTKLLSIERQITGRFCWNYDVVHFSFSKIRPIGNRQLPATHIWLVMLQMNYDITNSVKTVWVIMWRKQELDITMSSKTNISDLSYAFHRFCTLEIWSKNPGVGIGSEHFFNGSGFQKNRILHLI